MNSSLQIETGTIPLECRNYDFIFGIPQQFSTPAYSILVFNIIILVVTCPFTIVLNVLTMIAVKIKARLQSMVNIALACLAATDAMVGVFVQPLVITFLIMTLQGETTSAACRLRSVFKCSINFFSFSSLAHLVLMSADRYMAIKQSYSYDQFVTKARVLIVSAIALRQFRVAFIELLLKKNHAQAEELEKKMLGSLNAWRNVVTNQGGDREEQNVDQVDVLNMDIETYHQGGERGEQNINQVNANTDIETNQREDLEEQNVDQMNAVIDIETYQGGE
ncbi:hypothetical protein ACROYT_G035806 [Oculina patagonica]